MIRLPDSAANLSPVERFGLTVLVDSSRLLPVQDSAADVVGLTIAGTVAGGPPDELPDGSPRDHVIKDGDVTLQRSYLRVLGELAGGVAEQRSEKRDRYDRVPATENPLVARGRLRDAIVSREGGALRRSVEKAAGRRNVRLVAPWPDGRRWAVALTHDLDLVSGWPWFTLMRVAELAGKRRYGMAVEAAANGIAWIGRDPVWRGVRDLLDIEREAGIMATWFVICETPTLDTMRAGDVTYDPESPATRRILAAALEQGHEIGLHGSFATMGDTGRFRAQRDRLARLTGTAAIGVRQHFLRMRPGATHREMASAGFSYDATWGFADRNGFRLGVADVVPGWDAEREAPSGVDEVPLVWMDRALSKYAGIEDPGRWVDDARDLAVVCRDVNGLWVGLWHPNLTPALGYPRTPEAFRRLLDILVGGQPFMHRLDQIVAWRAARRSLAATRVGADGRVELVATRPWTGPAVLEDLRSGSPESQPWPRAVSG